MNQKLGKFQVSVINSVLILEISSLRLITGFNYSAVFNMREIVFTSKFPNIVLIPKGRV